LLLQAIYYIYKSTIDLNMKVSEKKKLRNKILNDIEELKTNIKNLEEQTKPIAPENSIGRVSRMDAINNKSVNEAALRQAKLKMNNSFKKD